MRKRAFLSAAAGAVFVSARLLHSLPEDVYAFPKYTVEFLNGLPVLNATAVRWLKHGLRGGELEFLDQPWEDDHRNARPVRKEIGSGEASPAANPASSHTLEHMRMGPRDSYICFIPQPLQSGPSLHHNSDADVTPARSWSLLQPLTGTCLYHRQGWFTYSYCHNDEIRQFREMIPAQARFPGTYIPEEDPERDAYTLGRAPRISENGADLTVAEQHDHATNLELARNAGSRYLVQRWGDGTICDMTGKGREVEVQFHCSMEMTDHILFVKETKTCSYVLVIHTPRLCGEPGFKSRHDAEEQAQIRCREIVDKKPEDQAKLPTLDHPMKVPMRKTVLPSPKSKMEKAADGSESKTEAFIDDLLRKTLEAIVAGKKSSGGADKAAAVSSDDQLVIEFVDGDTDDTMQVGNERLVDALRAAGYDVRTAVFAVDDAQTTIKGDVDKHEDDKKKEAATGNHNPADDPNQRDEL